MHNSCPFQNKMPDNQNFLTKVVKPRLPSIRTVERMCRSLALERDILPREHLLHCQQQNPDVQPHRQMVHIPHIQLKLPSPRDVVPPVDLSPSSYAGPHLMPPELLLRIQRQVLRQQRPRPYEPNTRKSTFSYFSFILSSF